MGFFSRILEKLGRGPAEAVPAPAAAPALESSAPAAAAAPAVQAVAMVDVGAKLEQRAAANPQKLNLRTFIVDLLKLLDIDSSLAARKQLAAKLQCPEALMGIRPR